MDDVPQQLKLVGSIFWQLKAN